MPLYRCLKCDYNWRSVDASICGKCGNLGYILQTKDSFERAVKTALQRRKEMNTNLIDEEKKLVKKGKREEAVAAISARKRLPPKEAEQLIDLYLKTEGKKAAAKPKATKKKKFGKK
jgi:Flp pilus assembly protein TadD